MADMNQNLTCRQALADAFQALSDEAVKAGLPAVEQLTGLSSLTPMLSKAGISPAMISQLVPALTKAVSSGGGQALADAFAAAVK